MVWRHMLLIGTCVMLMGCHSGPSPCETQPSLGSDQQQSDTSKGAVRLDNNSRPQFPSPTGEERLAVDGTLFDGGVVSVSKMHNYTEDRDERHRIETGTFKGTRYRVYYSDGSGSVQGLPGNTLDVVRDTHGTNWEIRCSVDKMDDTRYCTLSRGGLTIGIWKDGSHFVSIGYQHYPGSDVTVRIDKNVPITAGENVGFSAAQVEAIVDQLQKGEMILTRYQKWPYQTNRDESCPVFGFAQAWEILHVVWEKTRAR